MGYPDVWYEDCLPRIQDCATLTEAVYLGNQALARLKGHLLGGQDTFSYQIRRAKKAGREPGCYFGGIIPKSGRRGFAVYRDGKVIAQYTAMRQKTAVIWR